MSQKQLDRLVNVMLVVFVCLVCFSFGTWVGKSTAESEYRVQALEEQIGGNQ
jgi:hypothetical protein